MLRLHGMWLRERVAAAAQGENGEMGSRGEALPLQVRAGR